MYLILKDVSGLAWVEYILGSLVEDVEKDTVSVENLFETKADNEEI